MKVCTYAGAGTRERLGFIVGNDVLEAPAEFAGMLEFIRAGDAGRRAAEAAIARAPASARRPLSSVKLAPPIRPATLLCSGSNYTDHNR